MGILMAKRGKNLIKNYENHSFYCLNCGKKGIPVWRGRNHLYGKEHRKALYCPYCKITVNHMEIRNLEEEFQFKNNFAKGLYKEEAKKSISYIKESIKEII